MHCSPLLASALLATVVFASACQPLPGTPAPPTILPSTPVPATVAPALTARPAPTSVPRSALPTESASFQQVGGRDLGLSFEVPADWHKDPLEDVWRPASNTEDRPSVGIVRRAPDEVPDDTTLLPNHHTLTARSPVDLGWANGTRYIVEVGAPAAAGGGAEAHAVHVVVRLGGMAVYDVFSSAPAGSPDAIAAADQAREHLLRSVHLIGG